MPSWRHVRVPFTVPNSPVPLRRRVERCPFVPADPAARDERCREAYNIQVQGLATRLASSSISKAVIGVSGGLDSAQALLVTVRAMDRLGLQRRNVLGFSMPALPQPSGRGRTRVHLMESLGISIAEIDIRPSCLQMLKDLRHPYADGRPVYDLTFENVQAGERTSHLFRLANQHQALVVGTSDLSELALGWCTYGVGDQMSHYSVNASVPKTLIKYLIGWVIAAGSSTKRRRVSCSRSSTLLAVFLRRFFETSQFKRSALPNAPKVGSGGSSPRSDWRAPSDSHADAWLADLEREVRKLNAGMCSRTLPVRCR
jgi:NAD+ synthase (glutamine-hydrolysing)